MDLICLFRSSTEENKFAVKQVGNLSLSRSLFEHLILFTLTGTAAGEVQPNSEEMDIVDTNSVAVARIDINAVRSKRIRNVLSYL